MWQCVRDVFSSSPPWVRHKEYSHVVYKCTLRIINTNTCEWNKNIVSVVMICDTEANASDSPELFQDI